MDYSRKLSLIVTLIFTNTIKKTATQPFQRQQDQCYFDSLAYLFSLTTMTFGTVDIFPRQDLWRLYHCLRLIRNNIKLFKVWNIDRSLEHFDNALEVAQEWLKVK